MDVYIRYTELSNLISYAKGSPAYCRKTYWEASQTCNDSSTYDDFIEKLSKTPFALPSTIATIEDTGCGFCDQLYASMDNGFEINDQSGAAVDFLREDSANSLSAAASSTNTCDLKRGLRELDTYHVREPNRISVPRPRAAATLPV